MNSTGQSAQTAASYQTRLTWRLVDEPGPGVRSLRSQQQPETGDYDLLYGPTTTEQIVAGQLLATSVSILRRNLDQLSIAWPAKSRRAQFTKHQP